jgi:brefeldin A-inhibited guanine nucleotide-exchange protein
MAESNLDLVQFNEYLPQLYPLVTDMLSRDMAVELWQAVREFYVRVGQVQGLMERRAE